ncbi:hypothetical protein [Chelatococcus reniformis]|nr:hypothetical protein [Chelatococcus reniformis]
MRMIAVVAALWANGLAGTAYANNCPDVRPEYRDNVLVRYQSADAFLGRLSAAAHFRIRRDEWGPGLFGRYAVRLTFHVEDSITRLPSRINLLIFSDEKDNAFPRFLFGGLVIVGFGPIVPSQKTLGRRLGAHGYAWTCPVPLKSFGKDGPSGEESCEENGRNLKISASKAMVNRYRLRTD